MLQHRRGRRRGPRWITEIPLVRAFGPLDQPFNGTVELTYEELEAVRLVDYEGMEQGEAAAMMGVSRKSLWTELHSARTKLAKALVEGLLIQIEGGTYVLRTKAGAVATARRQLEMREG
jgi:predicted DNA-binding protein (UPF0251 family)